MLKPSEQESSESSLGLAQWHLPHHSCANSHIANLSEELRVSHPLAGYEDSMWTSAVVGLALEAIVIWVGFVVS
jgi:hypothetical protein